VATVRAGLHLERLDAEQRHAVEHPAGTLCILAGPGSGKTRVLTHRIARRVADGSADPRRTMALTFTRRAARELRERLEQVGVRDLGAVGTFHGLALAQIRRHRVDAGKRPPVVLGHRRQILAELADGKAGVPIGLAASEIEWAGAQGLTPDEYRHGPGRRRIGTSSAAAVASLHGDYNQYKRRRGMLDFDDLLVECTRLLRTEPSFRDAQQWLFRHFFVDEFQDLNATQFDLLRAWLGDRDDLCVVGDADQAIYGWNGADASYLTELAQHFPTTEVVELRTNHRSAAPIVRAAAAVLGRTVTDTGSGELVGDGGPPPTITEYPDGDAEALGIARHLRHQRTPGTPWRRFAVLTRTNDQLLVIARALDQLDVPYRLRGRGGVLRLPEVAEVVDQLVAAGPRFAATAADLVEELDDGPAARVAELAMQFTIEDPRPTGDAFRSWLRTVRPSDLDGGFDAVDLVTFHAAKGLEWPSVVVAGAEVGFVPIRDDDPEERRLLFVAVSRAEQDLTITWARHREVAGSMVGRERSPWLASIEAATAPPPPPPPERIGGLLAQARAAVGRDDVATRACAERLRRWRDDTARARRISAAALLDDSDIDLVAAAAPRTLDELIAVTGRTPERMRRISDEILSVVAGP